MSVNDLKICSNQSPEIKLEVEKISIVLLIQSLFPLFSKVLTFIFSAVLNVDVHFDVRELCCFQDFNW